MYILVIGNAAVNVRFLVSVYNDEGQSDGGVGRWSAILSHTLPIPLDEILKGQHLWTYKICAVDCLHTIPLFSVILLVFKYIQYEGFITYSILAGKNLSKENL